MNDSPPPLVTIFQGADFQPSPMHAADSDAALLALLGFLTLRPGDTDSECFDKYTPAQMAWAQSSECESLSGDVAIAEEVGGCACGVVWTNLNDHKCEDAPTVTTFEVLDHGEDGSQYFPGCPSHPDFAYKSTGVGDTAREALAQDAQKFAAPLFTCANCGGALPENFAVVSRTRPPRRFCGLCGGISQALDIGDPRTSEVMLYDDGKGNAVAWSGPTMGTIVHKQAPGAKTHFGRGYLAPNDPRVRRFGAVRYRVRMLDGSLWHGSGPTVNGNYIRLRRMKSAS